MATRMREGRSPFAIMSNQTSPTNVSDGPLVVGSLGWISNFPPMCPVANVAAVVHDADATASAAGVGGPGATWINWDSPVSSQRRRRLVFSDIPHEG